MTYFSNRSLREQRQGSLKPESKGRTRLKENLRKPYTQKFTLYSSSARLLRVAVLISGFSIGSAHIQAQNQGTYNLFKSNPVAEYLENRKREEVELRLADTVPLPRNSHYSFSSMEDNSVFFKQRQRLAYMYQLANNHLLSTKQHFQLPSNELVFVNDLFKLILQVYFSQIESQQAGFDSVDFTLKLQNAERQVKIVSDYLKRRNNVLLAQEFERRWADWRNSVTLQGDSELCMKAENLLNILSEVQNQLQPCVALRGTRYEIKSLDEAKKVLIQLIEVVESNEIFSPSNAHTLNEIAFNVIRVQGFNQNEALRQYNKAESPKKRQKAKVLYFSLNNSAIAITMQYEQFLQNNLISTLNQLQEVSRESASKYRQNFILQLGIAMCLFLASCLHQLLRELSKSRKRGSR